MKRKEIENIKKEIKLIKLEIYENEILIKKYSKRVNQEKTNKQEMLLQFNSVEEVQEAYGYGDLTEEEYNEVINYFENLENEKSINEMFLEYIKRTKTQNMDTLKYLEGELFKEELVDIANS